MTNREKQNKIDTIVDTIAGWIAASGGQVCYSWDDTEKMKKVLCELFEFERKSPAQYAIEEAKEQKKRDKEYNQSYR